MSFNFTNQISDKCYIHGCCVQEPYLNSINEYIVKLLINLIYYIKKLNKLNYENLTLKKDIVSYFAEINLNFDFHSKDLISIINCISSRLKETEKTYIQICKENKITPQLLKEKDKLPEVKSLNDIAQIGEKVFLLRQKLLSDEENTIYMIFLIYLKSMAQNLYEMYSYDADMKEETNQFILAFNKLNLLKNIEKKYISLIKNLYKANFKIIADEYKMYREKYGKIKLRELSFSTHKNKCILISGRTLKDLENLIKASNNENIDIYTHGQMIFAHQYEFFANSLQLIGQFQKEENSIKYDFSSFPGPILMGKFQQNKFEGLYRGNLFTTNKIAPYGVKVIEDNEYQDVFEIAKSSIGFKKSHQKPSLIIGYDEAKLNIFINELKENIINEKYNSILLIGLMHSKNRNSIFFENLMQKLSDKTFAISLAFELNIKNSIHFPSFFDYSLTLKILNELSILKKKKDFKWNTYITDCTSFLAQNIIILNYLGADNIFIQKCKKLPNTESLDKVLKKHFHTYVTRYNIDEDIKLIK